MQIVKKLEDLRQAIMNGHVSADLFASDGIKAMFAGMQRPVGTVTPQWARMMEYITKDQAELNRLCGLEPGFNQSRWGMACVAYIAGNSTCTSETAIAGGTIRAMSLEMIKNLDAEGQQLAQYENESTKTASNLAESEYTKELDR